MSSLREGASVDLARALSPLVESIGPPTIHLELPPAAAVDDPAIANALVRCVQEVTTNALRHAEAENLWVEITLGDGSIWLTAKDDGKGSREPRAGNGLRGLRERVEALAGSFSFRSEAGGGFEVEAMIPLAGEAR